MSRQTLAHQTFEEKGRVPFSVRELFVLGRSLTALSKLLQTNEKFDHRFHKLGRIIVSRRLESAHIAKSRLEQVADRLQSFECVRSARCERDLCLRPYGQSKQTQQAFCIGHLVATFRSHVASQTRDRFNEQRRWPRVQTMRVLYHECKPKRYGGFEGGRFSGSQRVRHGARSLFMLWSRS
jgi:hypothetical protein